MSGVGLIVQGILAKQLADEQARSVKAQGREAEKISRREGSDLKGTQRVLTAKSGVAREGTPLDVLAQTAEDVELNALRAKFGLDVRAEGLKIAGEQALISGVVGGSASIIGMIGAAALLGSAGGAAGSPGAAGGGSTSLSAGGGTPLDPGSALTLAG